MMTNSMNVYGKKHTRIVKIILLPVVKQNTLICGRRSAHLRYWNVDM